MFIFSGYSLYNGFKMKTLKINDETHKLLTMVKGGLIAASGNPNLTYDDAINKLIDLWSKEGVETGASKPLEPYHYVRFRWWNRADLEALAEELDEEYEVNWSRGPGTELEIDLRKEERNILKVKADSLGAYLDIYKAVLYQREPSPFTKRDAKLRERLFKVYDKNRPTPFPWEFLREPEFVVE